MPSLAPRCSLGRTQIAAHGTIDIVTYAIDRLEVVVVDDPDDTQAPPQIGLEAHGTQRFEQSTDPARPAGTEEPFARTFLIEFVNGYWLIAGDVPVSGDE